MVVLGLFGRREPDLIRYPYIAAESQKESLAQGLLVAPDDWVGSLII